MYRVRSSKVLLLMPDKYKENCTESTSPYYLTPNCIISTFNKYLNTFTGGPYKQCVCLCSKDKEMYGNIEESLTSSDDYVKVHMTRKISHFKNTLT